MGKDSLAMVLKLVEKKYPLDEVIFYDTEMEFRPIYDNCKKLQEYLNEHGIKFTMIRNPKSFEFMAFEQEICTKDGRRKYGYDWCGGLRRWGTSGKLAIINKYYKDTYGDSAIIEYVGIAFDERQRIEKYRLKRTKNIKLYPLVEWQMTEEDCLNYCYSHGWTWEENGFELYDLLDRVSCWCCANKNQKEIQNIILHLPEYWERIKQYEQRCGVPYKKHGCQYFEQKLLSVKQ